MVRRLGLGFRVCGALPQIPDQIKTLNIETLRPTCTAEARNEMSQQRAVKVTWLGDRQEEGGQELRAWDVRLRA